jgi:predicted alpha/beta-fold hydrolase
MRVQRFLKFFSKFYPETNQEVSVASVHAHQYSPSPLLPISFLQTIYDSLTPITKIDFRREKVFFEDGGHICLDWAETQKDLDENAPILVIMHGVTGGS